MVERNKQIGPIVLAWKDNSVPSVDVWRPGVSLGPKDLERKGIALVKKIGARLGNDLNLIGNNLQLLYDSGIHYDKEVRDDKSTLVLEADKVRVKVFVDHRNPEKIEVTVMVDQESDKYARGVFQKSLTKISKFVEKLT